jgi:hypothetical protein
MITAERERGAAPDTIPAADDHRAAAQRRVVALFDGRVEGIEVRVQDVGCLNTRAPHEHMFARGSDSIRWWRPASPGYAALAIAT